MKQITINYQVIPNYHELSGIEKRLFDIAKNAREGAYAPYSKFFVGCALLLENGEIVAGSNQENAAYPSGLCAERTAIFWASANFPNLKINKLFIIGSSYQDCSSFPIPPCGACRQSILEFETNQKTDIKIYFSSLEGEIIKTNSVRDLLPFSFDKGIL